MVDTLERAQEALEADGLPTPGLRLDLAYAVEPLARALYHAGAVGQVNAHNKLLQGESPAAHAKWGPLKDVPTEEQTTEYFAAWLPVQDQEAYRDLATETLEGIREQLFEAVIDGAQRRARGLTLNYLTGLEASSLRAANEVDLGWKGWRLWRRAVVAAHKQAALRVREVRKAFERAE